MKERKIGEVFEEFGKILKCVEKDDLCIMRCRECSFFGVPECLCFNCHKRDRKDAKSVYFIKATPAELEEYEQVEQARNRG